MSLGTYRFLLSLSISLMFSTTVFADRGNHYGWEKQKDKKKHSHDDQRDSDRRPHDSTNYRGNEFDTRNGLTRIRTLVDRLADSARKSARMAGSLRNGRSDEERINHLAQQATELSRNLDDVAENRRELRNELQHLIVDAQEAREAFKRTEWNSELSREWHRGIDALEALERELGQL